MKFIPFIVLIASFAFLTSCTTQEDVLPQLPEARSIASQETEFAEVPDDALQFVSLTYPNVPIQFVEIAPTTELFAFEISLENEVNVYFDQVGSLLWVEEFDLTGIGDETQVLPSASLPDPSLTYLLQTYPGVTVKLVLMNRDTSLRHTYEVLLANGTTIFFDADGTFLSKEVD
ncbi:MAG: PepSY-like domain-containing protein [Bacteroidota bacterium]